MVNRGARRCAALLALSLRLVAQQPVERHDSIVVTGAYEPLPLEEADRTIRLLPVRENSLLYNTWGDFLRLDPSLDLRQRAPGDVQADLSIRGGTFGQTLVLLNGVRLNDPQSGHHNMDIPVPVDSVAQVEVLHGAGSALYGSDAVGGAVNFVTRAPEASELRLRTSVGSFGINQQRGSATIAAGRFTQQLAFSRDFSSGFAPDRDYRNLALSSATWLRSALGTTDLILAHNDRPFGADQFYGNFNSWERTRTWFASLRQGLGTKTEGSFSFRRHTDLFVLYRDRPQVFTNRHAAQSWQATLRRREDLAQNVKFWYGAEGYHDSIHSNNLGHHARNRGAAYAAVDARALRRFSLSVGLRAEIYGGLTSRMSPTIAGGMWITSRLKLRASASSAFRLPSYTDLYYHDPASLGSPDLRPEEAWSYETGLAWNAAGRVSWDIAGFHRRERDGIDYMRRSLTDIWRAANIQNLNFSGVEAMVKVRAARAQQLGLSYTGLHGVRDAVERVYSRYVFNYPEQTAVAFWEGVLARGIAGRTRMGVTQRYARGPYALWEVDLARTAGRLHPFVQLSNLTNTRYQEILGVTMPGRTVIFGMELAVFLPRN